MIANPSGIPLYVKITFLVRTNSKAYTSGIHSQNIVNKFILNFKTVKNQISQPSFCHIVGTIIHILFTVNLANGHVA